MKLYKFYLETCSPCKVLEKTLTENNIPHISYDIDDYEELADKYNIKTVPTLVLVDYNDKEIDRIAGNVSLTAIKEFLSKNNYE